MYYKFFEIMHAANFKIILELELYLTQCYVNVLLLVYDINEIVFVCALVRMFACVSVRLCPPRGH